MNLNYRTTIQTVRQGLLPVFSKPFGVILTIIFLTCCAKNGPDILLPDDHVESIDLSGVDIDLEAGTITETTAAMQYSLNSTDGVNGTWTAASAGSIAVTFVEGKVYIRQADKWDNVRLVSTIGPGMIILVNLEHVEVDLEAGLIKGTTADMEYSLDSNDGTDGTWVTASDGNTAVTFVLGKVYVREAAFPTNVRLVRTVAPGDIPGADLNDVGVHVGEGNITGTSSDMEYSLDSSDGTDGTWTIAGNGNTAVTFVVGKVYIREAINPGNMRLVAELAPPAAAPQLTGDDNANTVIGLAEIHEYKIDDGAWTAVTGTIPPFTGDIAVHVRFKATETLLASEFQTINFTPGMYEDFEGSASLLERGWRNNSANNPPQAVFQLSNTDPFAGAQHLNVTGDTNGAMRKSFEKMDNVVFEWKMKSTGTLTNCYIAFHNEAVTSDDATKRTLRLNLYNGALRDYTNTMTVIYTPNPLIEWNTYRVVLTGNTFDLYVNDIKQGDTRPTGANGTITGAAQIHFTKSTQAGHIDLYIDDIKITAQ